MSIFFVFFNSKLKSLAQINKISYFPIQKLRKKKMKFWAKLEKQTYKKNKLKAQLV